jgi:ABC-2 type transport system permease protein
MAPAINPIIVRELHTRMRGIRPYLILTVFLVLMGLSGWGMLQLMLQQARFGMTVMSAQIGQALFKGLSFGVILLVVVLAPATTSSAISGEREQQTYDMLLATPLKPEQILWGKLVAALSYLLLMIFAAIPVFSVVFIFGGVTLWALVDTLVLLLATTVAFGAIGIFCSALLRRTARATIISYVVVLALIGGTIVGSAVWGQFAAQPGTPPPPWLLYLNPFSALTSVTTLAPPNDPAIPFFGYADPFTMIPQLALLSQGVLYYGQNGPIVLPIYRATILGYALLSVILTWIGAHLVRPYRRWRPGWSDLWFAVIVSGTLVLAWLTRTWWLVLPPTPFLPAGA